MMPKSADCDSPGRRATICSCNFSLHQGSKARIKDNPFAALKRRSSTGDRDTATLEPLEGSKAREDLNIRQSVMSIVQLMAILAILAMVTNQREFLS